jgi:hypothetical protein
VGQLIDAIVNALGFLGSGFMPNLVSQIQTGLQGLLPAVVQNANGTAAALNTAVITLNSNGTATYNAVVGSVHSLVDQANGTMATVAQSLEAQAQAAIANAGSNLTAAAANVQSVINSLFGGFGVGLGAAAPASTPVQALQAVASAQQQLLDNAAGLAALNALLTQASNGGGLSVSVNFSSYTDGALPGIFTATANLTATGAGAGGVPAVVGGVVIDSGVSSGGGYSALYNVATTTTDQQIISGVFSGATGTSYAILLGRVNSAGTSYVYAIYVPSGSYWLLGTVVAGTNTQLAVVYDTFSAGAVYSLQCGTGSVGNRAFRILKNGNPLTFTAGSTTFIESGTISQLGASYRGGGFAVAVTSKCSTWTIVDNTPPAAVGSGFRAYRTTTTSTAFVTPAVATWTTWNGTYGLAFFPASGFDTIEYQTTDLTYTASTNTVTVSVAGWYTVTISAFIGATGTAAPGVGLWKNGSFSQAGQMTLWSTGQGPVVQSTFSVYLAAGDTITPGVWYGAGGSSFTCRGDSLGASTYIDVAFSNRGTLS